MSVLPIDEMINNISNTTKIYVYLKTYGKGITLSHGEAIDLLRILGNHIQFLKCDTMRNKDGIAMIIIEL